jgi:cell wall-associated NlpC family hydrolase
LELQELSEVLNERKTRVEANIGIWREWQRVVTLQAETEHQGVVMSQLAILADIGQVKVILNRLWLNALQLMYGRNFAVAQQMLASYSWFKSIVPLYFADKITTQDQADFLKSILDEAREKENEIIAHFNLLSSIAGLRLFAEGEGEGGGESEGEDHDGKDEDPGNDNFPKSSGDVIDIGSRMDPGTGREYDYQIENLNGSAMVVLKINKGVCKYDDAGNGTVQITAEGKGFVEQDADHNPTEKADLPSGPELQKVIDHDLQTAGFNFSATLPCGPRPDGGQDLKNDTDKLGKMIDHAQSQAKDDSEKKGLQTMKAELKKFQDYQDLLNNVVHDKTSWISHAQEVAQSGIKNLSKSLPVTPATLTPPLIDSGHILDQLNKIRNSMWNFALSAGMAISNALTDFIENQVNQAPASLQHAAKDAFRAAKEHTKPGSIAKPGYPAITPAIRQVILNKAKALRDGAKIIKYSQANRLGPDSYDCSGFVTSMYAAAGLGFGNPSVKQIFALAGLNGPFREISVNEAQPGDLVAWKETEGENTYDHVAVFDGVQTVHTKHGDATGPAVISTSKTAYEEGRNTIQEILIKYMMGDPNNPIYHILQWAKK